MTYKKYNNRKLRDKHFVNKYTHKSYSKGFTIEQEAFNDLLASMKDIKDPAVLLQRLREV